MLSTALRAKASNAQPPSGCPFEQLSEAQAYAFVQGGQRVPIELHRAMADGYAGKSCSVGGKVRLRELKSWMEMCQNSVLVLAGAVPVSGAGQERQPST